mmetsp:Transcript_24790/g.78618  ORF Transcript_24790/g.78618 Transcript_24790/m.78618 type:complete len:280 (-) Transcript_24790:923-1762(-)
MSEGFGLLLGSPTPKSSVVTGTGAAQEAPAPAANITSWASGGGSPAASCSASSAAARRDRTWTRELDALAACRLALASVRSLLRRRATAATHALWSTLQAGPCQPGSHRQPSAPQAPCPQHRPGQCPWSRVSRWLQDSPVQPLRQAHLPSAWHCPWPEHDRGQLTFAALAQAGPAKPGKHWHCPEGRQRPLLLHFVEPPGQRTSTEQSSPLQPLSQTQRPSCEQAPCPLQSVRHVSGCMQSWPVNPGAVQRQNSEPTHSPRPPHMAGHGSNESKTATSP